MEYKKDERTKNLRLRDIHVGDWVQVWSEQTERYSPPLKIIQICDDGTVYLIGSEEERPTPWEEDIKNIDALPITPELIEGFGMKIVKNEYQEYRYYVYYNGDYVCELRKIISGYKLKTLCHNCDYFHEVIDFIRFYCPRILNLEWKGIEK